MYIYLVDVELLILFEEAQYVSIFMLFGVIVMLIGVIVCTPNRLEAIFCTKNIRNDEFWGKFEKNGFLYPRKILECRRKKNTSSKYDKNSKKKKI